MLSFLLDLDAQTGATLASILVFGAGFALLLREVRMAMGLFAAAIAILALPEIGRALLVELKPLIIQYVSSVPTTVLIAASLLMVVVVALLVLQRLFTLFFGRQAAAVAVGGLLTELIVFLLRVVVIWPFRLLAGAIGFIASRLR